MEIKLTDQLLNIKAVEKKENLYSSLDVSKESFQAVSMKSDSYKSLNSLLIKDSNINNVDVKFDYQETLKVNLDYSLAKNSDDVIEQIGKTALQNTPIVKEFKDCEGSDCSVTVASAFLSGVKSPIALPAKFVLNYMTTEDKVDSIANSYIKKDYDSFQENAFGYVKSGLSTVASAAQLFSHTQKTIDKVHKASPIISNTVGKISKAVPVLSKGASVANNTMGHFATTVSKVSSRVAVPFAVGSLYFSGKKLGKSYDELLQQKYKIKEANIKLNSNITDSEKALIRSDLEKTNSLFKEQKIKTSILAVSTGLSAVSTVTLAIAAKNPLDKKSATISLVTGIASSVVGVFEDKKIRTAIGKKIGF